MPADLNPTWREKLRIIRHSIEMRGVRRSMADLLIYFLQELNHADPSFDAAHGTDTAGHVHPAPADDPLARAQATVYTPSPADVTNWMLDRLRIGPADYTFVDYGCGKGRVVLVASCRPFRRVIGVELDAGFAATARSNVEVFRRAGRGACPEVDIVHADARHLAPPAGNLVLHFYLPFGDVILTEVLQRVVDTVRPGATVYVIFLCPTGSEARVERAFAKFPYFRQAAYFQSVCMQYDWMVYVNAEAPF